MSDPQQSALEARLVELSASAIFNIQTLPTLQDGKLKDAETALEREFASMRAVMRELQFLAEDQEEEDEMSVQERLQRYQQQYQDIQASYSQAKLQKRADPQEDNRRLLLAGADPTKRQQELQSEAELVGAAQSVTGSLQRSRQVMLEQIGNTQSILASMDASHEQLSKVTKEYQGQSDVFGTSKRLLRTLKRHSSWDKLVLYGGALMFLLVCLYVVQKRSLYFVPTFVKTGLGKLVPTWSRSSTKNIDHLTRPVKARGDDPGTDGLRQKPSQETLANAQQAQQLLQRHSSQQKPADPPDKQSNPTPPETAPGAQASAAAKAADQESDSLHRQQPRDSAQHNAASTAAEPDRRFVTDQQMRDSGHAEAFARILQDIPESVRQGGPKGPDYTGKLSAPSTNSDTASASSAETPSSTKAGDASASSANAGFEHRGSSNGDGVLSPSSTSFGSGASADMGFEAGDSSKDEEVQKAVAAATERAEEQQQHQALSLDAGQAYPQHPAQAGDATLPRHAALLADSDAIASAQGASSAGSAETGTQTDENKTAVPDSLSNSAETGTQTDHVTGAVPGSLSNAAERQSLQDNVSDAISGILGTASSSDRSQESQGSENGDASSSDRFQEGDGGENGDVNVEQPLQTERQQTEAIAPGSSDVADTDQPVASQPAQENTRGGQSDSESAEHSTAGSSGGSTVFQTEAQELGSAARGEQVHSVPQEEAGDSSHSDAGTQLQTDSQDLAAVSESAPRQSVAQQSGASDADAAQSHEEEVVRDRVTQQQMDDTGYGDAFAAILASIPDHVREKSAEQQTGEAPEHSASDLESQKLHDHSEL